MNHLAERSRRVLAPLAALVWVLLATLPLLAQQGTVVLVGTVRDAASGQPVADAVITVTSPSLQGEELTATDAKGEFRIPALPPGVYVMRIDQAGFRP